MATLHAITPKKGRKVLAKIILQAPALAILMLSPFATWAALMSQSVALCGATLFLTATGTALALTAEAL